MLCERFDFDTGYRPGGGVCLLNRPRDVGNVVSIIPYGDSLSGFRYIIGRITFLLRVFVFVSRILALSKDLKHPSAHHDNTGRRSTVGLGQRIRLI